MPDIRFDQGDTGAVNRSRSDVAAGTAVDVVALAVAGTAVFSLLDKPPGSAAVLAGAGSSRQITPDLAGTYRLRIVDDADSSEVIHTFTVRTALRDLPIPAHNERASRNANEADPDPGTWVDESETNEGGSNRGYEPALREIFQAVENSDPNSDRATGMVSGGLITAGGPAGSVTISDGLGYVASYANPATPSVTRTPWSGLTDVPIAAIATTGATFLLITPAGGLLQISGTAPTEAQINGNIFLGWVTHPDNATIDNIIAEPRLAYARNQDMSLFMRQFDPLLVNGVDILGVALSLQIQVTAGQLFAEGANVHNDPNRPSLRDIAARNPVVFDRIYSDGTPGGDTNYDAQDVTLLDPTQYDLGGLLVSISGNASRASIQRLYLDPAGNVYIAYGQEVFSSIVDAQLIAGKETFVESALMQFSTLLGRWIIRRGAADTDNENDAIWLPAVGGASGGGGVPLDEYLARFVSNTGWLSGGAAVEASPTTVDIAAGTGRVTDVSDPANPLTFELAWPEQLGVTLTGIAADDATLLAFDKDSQPVQILLSAVNHVDYRDYVFTAVIGHFGGGSTITSVNNNPYNIGYNGHGTMQDFLREVIGPAQISGVNVTPNGANLSLDNDAGELFLANRYARITPKTPDIVPVASGTAFAFSRAYRSADPGRSSLVDGPPVTVINPALWDDGSGVLQVVPNNDWTIQRVYRGVNGWVVAYGQAVYNTEALALDALNQEAFTEKSPLPELALRAYIVVREDAADLAAGVQATFIKPAKFRVIGQAGGGVPAVGSYIGLTDTPATYAGQAGRTTMVAEDETRMVFAGPVTRTVDLALEFVDDDSVRLVGPGAMADDAAPAWMDFSAGPQVADVTLSGAGGLDTGVAAPSTIYYVFAISEALGANAAALLSISPTAPTLPGAYINKRLIGWAYRNSANEFMGFVCSGTANRRTYRYTSETTSARDNRFLDASTTPIDLDVGNVIPVQAFGLSHFLAVANGSAGGVTGFLALTVYPEGATPGYIFGHEIGFTGDNASTVFFDCGVNPSNGQTTWVASSASLVSTILAVLGAEYEI